MEWNPIARAVRRSGLRPLPIVAASVVSCLHRRAILLPASANSQEPIRPHRRVAEISADAAHIPRQHDRIVRTVPQVASGGSVESFSQTQFVQITENLWRSEIRDDSAIAPVDRSHGRQSGYL